MTDTASRMFAAFNTWNTVQIAGFKGDAEAVLDKIERLAEHYESLLSHTRGESTLNRINDAEGQPVEVEAVVADIVREALHYCERTDGLFDITIGPAFRLWDFYNGDVPAAEKLAKAVEHIDWRMVKVDGDTVQLTDPEGMIILGGIAKGYMADAMYDLLKQQGVEHAIINLGGNVKVLGGKPDGSPWNVGVRAPIPTSEGDERSCGYASIFDGAVVTSGVYERSFVDDEGIVRHHILDPRTGMPVETDLLSATLICERALDADGYTTALVAMGLEKALAFVEQLEGAEAVFIGRDGLVYATSGIGDTVPFEMLAS